MPRRPNYYQAGHFYHVMTKTHNDEFRLVEKDDILALEAFITLYKHIHGIKIFAYCIMSNHIHFLIQNSDSSDESIFLFFRDFKREFAKYYNIAYGRKGAFWKEGNTQKEIQSEVQIVNTLVYILNNPVRARKCEAAWEYAFSSFHLPMTQAAFKTLKQTKNLFSSQDALKFIRRVKKNTFYACRLPKEEHLARGLAHVCETPHERRIAREGRKDYKLRGPFTYRHPHNPYCKVIDIRQSFTAAVTDKLPEIFSVDSKTIREYCQMRAQQEIKDPFKEEGMNILFESVSRKACYRYQELFCERLPVGAQQSYSVIPSGQGTWQLVIIKGRPKKKNQEN